MRTDLHVSLRNTNLTRSLSCTEQLTQTLTQVSLSPRFLGFFACKKGGILPFEEQSICDRRECATSTVMCGSRGTWPWPGSSKAQFSTGRRSPTDKVLSKQRNWCGESSMSRGLEEYGANMQAEEFPGQRCWLRKMRSHSVTPVSLFLASWVRGGKTQRLQREDEGNAG